MSGVIQLMVSQKIASAGGSREYTAGNLILFPEDLNNAVWNKGYLAVSSTGNTDPFGGSTSIKYNNWSSTRTTIRQTVTVTTGVEYTLTFYAKKGTTTDMRWGVTNTLNQVIVASTSYLSQTTQDVWELVSVSFTSASTNLYIFIAYDHGSTGTFEVWGANLDLTSNY